uniref:Uncharacterized protein n=1 Tax=Ixodes ricinus TaxID=34613 RepID=A0A6B0UCS3_IXORI
MLMSPTFPASLSSSALASLGRNLLASSRTELTARKVFGFPLDSRRERRCSSLVTSSARRRSFDRFACPQAEASLLTSASAIPTTYALIQGQRTT